MGRLQIRCVLIFVITFSVKADVKTQSLAADSAAPLAVKNAIALYSNSFRQQLHLYNGPQYREYSFPFTQGQPYFLQPEFSVGTVSYDSNHYNEVSILYNLVTDDIIILANNKVSKIRLLKEKVAAFSLSGHSFSQMARDSVAAHNIPAGFYDLLVNGKLALLAKRIKLIQEYPKQVLEHHVVSRDQFYLKVGHRYHKIESKKSFLTLLANKKKETQQYIKQNKLNFKKDRENTMIRLVNYYNQLNM